MQILDEANDSVSSVQIRGYKILTSSIDGHVRTYDIRMASLIQDNLTVPTTFACFSRDQNTILANCLDATIRLLDISTGDLLKEYAGHKNEKYKLDCYLAANDAVVIAGSEDSSIYIWDLIDAKIVSTLSSHTMTVTSLSVHPDRPYLLSASVDGLIKLWESEAS